MVIKCIRGAITADNNTIEDMRTSTLELFSEVVKRNNISEENVAYVEFSVTKDLNAAYPAKFIRKDFGWSNTAFMCVQEMDVKDSLPMCIRVLVVYNCPESFEPEYVYLKGAKDLRS